MIEVFIDYREKALIKLMIDKEKDFNFKQSNLELGDIVFKDDKNGDMLIIERKTLNDLASSIRDGRYNEQSMRLNAHPLHNHNIIYLIEGDINFYQPPPLQNPVTRDALYSSMFSILYFKGFSIIKTKNLTETLETIVRFYNKLCKEVNKSAYYSNTCINNDTSINNDIEYVNTIKTRKKDNITTDNIDIIMLSQIPNVSLAIATTIIETYSSLGKLIDALKKDETCLNNLNMIVASGKTRRISKTAINNVIKYLKISDGVPCIVNV